jgi:ribonuclease P protein component
MIVCCFSVCGAAKFCTSNFLHARMKWDKLKSSKTILRLFTSGKSHLKFPLLLKWEIADKSPTVSPDILFTPAVSSKKIKRAVDRNLIKRRIREAVWNDLKNTNHKLLKENSIQVTAVYIYLAGEPLPYKTLERSVKRLNKDLIEKINQSF